jgi:hypothetical protein
MAACQHVHSPPATRTKERAPLLETDEDRCREIACNEGLGHISCEQVSGDRAMAWHLGGDIIANKLVDVPVGCSEVLPHPAGSTLWLRIDELDSSGKQSTLCDREVVDLKGDHRPFSEELVVFVIWTIDMDFGPVLQLEPDESSMHRTSRPSTSR